MISGFLKDYIVKPIFIFIDKKMRARMGITPLPGSAYNLIFMNYTTFTGEAIDFQDGTRVEPGDRIGELHFSNLGIASGKLGDTTITSELQLLSIVRSEIALLSTLVKENKIAQDIKAFYSISLFGPGAKRIGFVLREIPQTFHVKRIALWMSILRKVFSPAFTNRSKKHRRHTRACEIWITRKKLLEM
ncbi:MAG: YkoP family protein [Clostridia bacterium]|jgi:hypothetical protein